MTRRRFNRNRPSPGGGKPQRQRRPLPDKLEDLPYVTPQMVENFRRMGVYTPADLRGRSSDELYAALQRSYGELPQHSVLYVLRAVVHFVKTGERRDWRDFVDVGHKRPRQQSPPERRSY